MISWQRKIHSRLNVVHRWLESGLVEEECGVSSKHGEQQPQDTVCAEYPVPNTAKQPLVGGISGKSFLEKAPQTISHSHQDSGNLDSD